MSRSDRLAVLLRGFEPEEQIRLRPASWAAEFLGLSVPTVYRLVAEGKIPHMKLAGAERKSGRGKAGRVMFRLVDLIEWSSEREVAVIVAEAPRLARQIGADLRAVRLENGEDVPSPAAAGVQSETGHEAR